MSCSNHRDKVNVTLSRIRLALASFRCGSQSCASLRRSKLSFRPCRIFTGFRFFYRIMPQNTRNLETVDRNIRKKNSRIARIDSTGPDGSLSGVRVHAEVRFPMRVLTLKKTIYIIFSNHSHHLTKLPTNRSSLQLFLIIANEYTHRNQCSRAEDDEENTSHCEEQLQNDLQGISAPYIAY